MLYTTSKTTLSNNVYLDPINPGSKSLSSIASNRKTSSVFKKKKVSRVSNLINPDIKIKIDLTAPVTLLNSDSEGEKEFSFRDSTMPLLALSQILKLQKKSLLFRYLHSEYATNHYIFKTIT